jgi:quercetin dioxygenase-like cupin family protein
MRRGWTLQALAARSGLSKTFLSRLESGHRQASIAAVLTLSRVFDVSLATLFESPPATEPCAIIRAADAVVKTINGLACVPLSHAGRFFNLQPMRIKVSPSRHGNEHYHHVGEEWIYVLSGKLRLSLGDKAHDLLPGDAAHFDSRLPHRLTANGQKDAEVLVVAAPVSGARLNPYLNNHRVFPIVSPLPLPHLEPVADFRRGGLNLKSAHFKKAKR